MFKSQYVDWSCINRTNKLKIQQDKRPDMKKIVNLDKSASRENLKGYLFFININKLIDKYTHQASVIN